MQSCKEKRLFFARLEGHAKISAISYHDKVLKSCASVHIAIYKDSNNGRKIGYIPIA
jgi:hypothetical protein